MRLADAIACKLGLVDDDDQEHALQVRMPADAIRYRVGMFLTGRRDRRGKARRGVKAAQVKRRAKRRGRRHDRRRYAHAASDSRRTITYPEIDSEPLKLQTLVLVHGQWVSLNLTAPGRA